MTTFQVGIGKEDIQVGVPLPEDWYVMEISREPYEDKNNAWKSAGETLSLEEAATINPKAGKNIVVPLVVVSEMPEFTGRTFTKWLSLPTNLDEGKFMNNGQPKADWKADIIYKWVEAFGGKAEGTEGSLTKGAKALVYVVTGKEGENEIPMNVNPRSIGGEGVNPLGGGGLL